MKRKKIAGKGRIVCSANLFCLVILSLLMNGCSYHDQHYSYFNMLDEQKRTMSNKQAAEKFWSSVRPVSTLSDSYYKLGRHYLQKGEYDKAIGEFSKALRNDNSYCKAYNGLAMSYDALRRCESARTSYEQALQCAPDQAYVYNNYACSSLLCGDYQKGLALLQKAEKLAEGNARIKNNLKLAQNVAVQENISDRVNTKQLPALVAKATLEQPKDKQATPLADTLNKIQLNTTTDEKYDMDVSDALIQKNSLLLLEGGTKFKPQLTQKLSADKIKRTLLPNNNMPSPNYAKNGIEISNGNGVTGMAGRSAEFFREYGFNIRSITNAENFRFQESIIYYKDGYLPVAKELVAIIPGAQNLKKVDSFAKASIGVKVLLGRDLVGMHFPESSIGISRIPPVKEEPLLTSTISVSALSVRY
jgi:tetratricopeptide (TPR) repeat protein